MCYNITDGVKKSGIPDSVIKCFIKLYESGDYGSIPEEDKKWQDAYNSKTDNVDLMGEYSYNGITIWIWWQQDAHGRATLPIIMLPEEYN